MEKTHISAQESSADLDLRLSTLELKPHQKLALTNLSDGKILWGGVGDGKSRVAVAYYLRHHFNKDVYVITTAKKRESLDWEEEFARVGIGKAKDATVGGVLTVDSWNNLHKYKDIKGTFFIFDEQRLVGKGQWVKSFLKLSQSNRWLMLSATPGDTWIDYIPVFVANGLYRNRTDFNSQHIIYKPFQKFPIIDRYVGEGKLLKHRANLLVRMPYPKMTIRHNKTVTVEYSESLVNKVFKDKWHIFADRPIRDIAELWLVLRRIINSDPSRVRTIRKLLETHPKLIIFYSHDYELELLRGLCDVTEVAELNGHYHDDIPNGDGWVYLVQYAAGSEAWNCVETNAICFYSLTYSYKQWEQAHGRIDRMNTPFVDLFYYILRSKSWVDSAIWGKLRVKQNFNANDVDLKKVKSNA